MGSSKNAGKDPKRKGRKNDAVAQLAEEIRLQRADLAQSTELLRAAIGWNATVQQRLEAVLVAQRRTNSLLELSLGSAFDAELEPPDLRG